MSDSWQTRMACVAVLGSIAGLFWPLIFLIWSAEMGKLTDSARSATGGGLGAKPRAKRQGLFVRALQFFLAMAVLPVVRIGTRGLKLALLAVIVGCVAISAGILTFLSDPKTVEALQAFGPLGYIVAFNYGFTAASIVGVQRGEPVRGRAEVNQE